MHKSVRIVFEEWVSDNGQSPKAIERNPFGDYKLMQTNTLWMGCAFGMREEREACAKLCAGDSPDADYFVEAIRARSNDASCLNEAKAQRPVNCGTGHCSCIECLFETKEQ